MFWPKKLRSAYILIAILFSVLTFTSANALPVDIQLFKPANSTVAEWPVSFGVPFRKGQAWEGGLVVVDAQSVVQPSQVKAMATWDDGSLRWALIDFKPDLMQQYQIVAGTPANHSDDIQLPKSCPGSRGKGTSGVIAIDTTAACFEIDADAGFLSRIWLRDTGGSLISVIDAGSDALYVEQVAGQRALFEPSTATSTVIELDGPRHLVVRVEGEYRFNSATVAAGVVYYHFYAGQAAFRVSHKLIVTDDLPGPYLLEAGLELSRPAAVPATLVTFNSDHDDTSVTAGFSLSPTDQLVMVQDAFPYFESLDSTFAIRNLATVNPPLLSGTAAGDWADLSGPNFGIAAQLPAFAEQFPKSFVADPGSLSVKFWAPERSTAALPARQMDFNVSPFMDEYFPAASLPPESWILGDSPARTNLVVGTGSARTHELWIYPHLGPLTNGLVSGFGGKEDEIFALPDPQWISSTGAMGVWKAEGPEFAEVEQALDDYLDRAAFAKDKVFPAAGYFYYGMYPFSAQLWSTGNLVMPARWSPQANRLARGLEYNFRRALWTLVARGGEARYFHLARQMTRHFRDFLFSSWQIACKPKGWMILGGVNTVFATPVLWGQFSNQATASNCANVPANFNHDTGVALVYESSGDIIQFVYDYFLTGDFHSRDMATEWRDAMIAEMTVGGQLDVDKAMLFNPETEFLRPLSAAYELDHDLALWQYGHEVLGRMPAPFPLPEQLHGNWVYGIKTTQLTGQLATRLFRVAPDGGVVEDLGALLVAGVGARFDGLAISHQGKLYAFEVNGNPQPPVQGGVGSRLVTFELSAAPPANIEVSMDLSFFAGQVVGAAFDTAGHLWALDLNSHLFQVDLATGAKVVGSTRAIAVQSVGIAFPTALSAAMDGSLYGLWQERRPSMIYDYLFQIDPGEGYQEIFREQWKTSTSAGPDGIYGLAFLRGADSPDHLFALRCGPVDELVRFDLDAVDPVSGQVSLVGGLLPASDCDAGTADLAGLRTVGFPESFDPSLGLSVSAKAGEYFQSLYSYYVSTGDERARDFLVRRVQTAYWLGAVSNISRDFQGRHNKDLMTSLLAAYDATDNRVFRDLAAAAAEDLPRNEIGLAEQGLLIDTLHPLTADDFGPQSLASHDVHTIGLPLAMNALANTNPVHRYLPLAVKGFPTARTYLLFNRTDSSPAFLDIAVWNVGEPRVRPRLLDASVPAQEVGLRVWDHRWQRIIDGTELGNEVRSTLGGRREGYHFFRVEIPSSVGPGIYHLDLGEQVAFALLDSDIEQVLQVAPEGIPLMRAKPYYFVVPDGVSEVHFFTHRGVAVWDPQGNEVVVEFDPGDGSSTDLGKRFFPVSQSGIWKMQAVNGIRPGATAGDPPLPNPIFRNLDSADTFVRFLQDQSGNDLPLIIALGEASRIFDLDPDFYPSSAPSGLGWPPSADGQFTKGRFGLGFGVKNRWVELDLPAAGLDATFPTEKGTAEFWYQPMQDGNVASYDNLEAQNIHYLFAVLGPGASNFAPHYSIKKRSAQDGNREGGIYNTGTMIARVEGGTLKTPGWFYPAEGRWYHVAMTWDLDPDPDEAGEPGVLRLFVNGREKGKLLPKQGVIGLTNVLGAVLRLGSYHDLAASAFFVGVVVDELRVSKTLRYGGDFTPPRAAFVWDDDTYLLMPLDGDLSAATSPTTSITGALTCAMRVGGIEYLRPGVPCP